MCRAIHIDLQQHRGVIGRSARGQGIDTLKTRRCNSRWKLRRRIAASRKAPPSNCQRSSPRTSKGIAWAPERTSLSRTRPSASERLEGPQRVEQRHAQIFGHNISLLVAVVFPGTQVTPSLLLQLVQIASRCISLWYSVMALLHSVALILTYEVTPPSQQVRGNHVRP